MDHNRLPQVKPPRPTARNRAFFDRRNRLGWTISAILATAVHAAPTAQASPPPRSTSRSSVARLPDGFVGKQIELSDGSVRKYVVFTPAQYDQDPNHRWPVLVSLHGSPDCGTDGERHIRIGLPRIIAERPASFPFITVMPQAKTLWFRGDDSMAVWTILETVHREYRTDRDRVYLTGISMGGYGAWELAMLRPDVFAAVVPVAGVGPTEYVSNIAHLPVWAFHGGRDRNVPVAGSRKAIEALRNLGAEPKYTEFPGKPHNIWEQVYRPQKLWRWLLKQRRPPPPRVIDYKLMTSSARVWWLSVSADPGFQSAAESPPHIRAEIGTDGKVTINSERVISWALVSENEPLRPGTTLAVEWNGVTVFQGKFDGVIGVTPRNAAEVSTTCPTTTRPGDSK